MGINKAPIKLILRTFESMVNTPRAVAMQKMRIPSGFEKTMFIIRRIKIIVIESTL